MDLTSAPFLPPLTEERPKNSSSSSAVEEEATRRISQKLLMGWAMLDETCRNSANLCTGSVPLMRDKQGQVGWVRLSRVCDLSF